MVCFSQTRRRHVTYTVLILRICSLPLFFFILSFFSSSVCLWHALPFYLPLCHVLWSSHLYVFCFLVLLCIIWKLKTETDHRCLCVCVCVRESDSVRERERICVWLCVCMPAYWYSRWSDGAMHSGAPRVLSVGDAEMENSASSPTWMLPVNVGQITLCTPHWNIGCVCGCGCVDSMVTPFLLTGCF